MTRALSYYLSRAIHELLKDEPFSGWQVVRSVETDPRLEVRYEFDGHGVEVVCDEHERIRTVFLHRGDGERLVDISFAMRRAQVLARFGIPAESGHRGRIAGLGDHGAWDRFALPQGVLHVQYGVERDEIRMVTLIRADAVP